MDHPIEKPGSVETVARWEPFSIRALAEDEGNLRGSSQPDCFGVFWDEEVHSRWVDAVTLRRSLLGAVACLDALSGNPVQLEYDPEEGYWVRKDSPAPASQGGWRLVSEDPPELGVDVLVCVHFGPMTTARRYEDGWFEVRTGSRPVPTHWHPLPAPPVIEGVEDAEATEEGGER